MARSTTSRCPRRRRLSSRRPDRREEERGFTLSETLVALAVASILFLAALSMLALDNRVFHGQDQVLEITREARHALDQVEREVRMAGYLVDTRTIADNGPDGTASTSDDIVGQAKIVYAAPWEFIYNADLDSRIGTIIDGRAIDSVPSGYAPVTFYTGAETIRYTLDSSGDGSVTSADRGDELEETVTSNSGLYALKKYVYGDNGTTNVNPSASLAMVRGPVNYPSGARPQPLFLYWGRFDSDVALDLWGDNGAGGGTAGNGTLEAGEIAALTAVTDEDADDDSVIDSGEDRNGNGILERRVSELIDQVEIRITTETPYPDKNYTDPVRSSSTNPFRNRVVTLNTIVKPRNTDLAGGACGDDPERTTSPSLASACAGALADGKVRLSWTLSPDDGGGETDVERYVLFRTDRDNIFGPTPYDEVVKNTASWEDDWVEMRTWPPKQYWYRVRAMDCTPRLSVGDPVAGPYPALVGAMYASSIAPLDVPGDDGTNLDVVMTASPDDPSNTTGYGDDVAEYHVYRSTSDDYRCVAPVNRNAINASGQPSYTFRDNSTNSTSGLALGTLYYYWSRTVDANRVLSPYSPVYCGRPYVGPAFPLDRRWKVMPYGNSTHPVEVYFTPRADNVSAGYDPYLIDYRIYKADSSRVDISVGYPASSLVATVRQRGTLYAISGATEARSHRSLDGGDNFIHWSATMVEPDNAVSFGSFLDGVMASNAGRAFFTNDGGVTWAAATTTSANHLRDVVHYSEDVVVAVGDSGDIQVSNDRGAHFDSVASGAVTDLYGVAAAGTRIVAVGRGGTASLSTDQGRSFSLITPFTSDNLLSACGAVIGGSMTFFAGGNAQVWYSTDGGDSWNRYNLPAGATDVISLACLENGVVYAATAANVYRSTDAGASWSTEPVYPAGATDIVTFGDGRIAFVADSYGRAYRRPPDGSSWSYLMVDSAGEIVRGLAVRPEVAWDDTATNAAASGTTTFYVVTARYDQGVSALDGESGLLADRSPSLEVPDDNEAQVLVDSCGSIEIAATQP